MPVFELSQQFVFPNPELAEEGLIAIGGDLQPERLLLAYEQGIFPWPIDEENLYWWSPEIRFILYPDQFKPSKSLRRLYKKNFFEIKYDFAFEEVIKRCQSIFRKDNNGTWITNEIMEGYIKLHKLGFAHSVESWYNGKLVGGLYGVSLGKAFFGESMFHLMSDASKIALYALVELMKEWDFEFIDAQMHTNHLESLGGTEILRTDFLELLSLTLKYPTKRGNWSQMIGVK